MENWCHPILAQHIYGVSLPTTIDIRPEIADQEEDTGVAIGADDHGVDYPCAFSTNFFLSSLKPSVRVSNNTLIPLYACLYLCCLAAYYMWSKLEYKCC